MGDAPDMCPKCGSQHKLWMQRSPDGNSKCECGFEGKHTEWINVQRVIDKVEALVKPAQPQPRVIQAWEITDQLQRHVIEANYEFVQLPELEKFKRGFEFDQSRMHDLRAENERFKVDDIGRVKQIAKQAEVIEFLQSQLAAAQEYVKESQAQQREIQDRLNAVTKERDELLDKLANKHVFVMKENVRLEKERDAAIARAEGMENEVAYLRKINTDLAVKLHEANMSLPLTNTGWPHEKKLHEKLTELQTHADKLAECLDGLKEQLSWYANVFAGWEDRPHEFGHWWRVEVPSQIDDALAAYAKAKGEK